MDWIWIVTGLGIAALGFIGLVTFTAWTERAAVGTHFDGSDPEEILSKNGLVKFLRWVFGILTILGLAVAVGVAIWPYF